MAVDAGAVYTFDEQGVPTKIPQTGTVEIHDDVEVGACVTIDRARFGVTRIGPGVKIDNLVQIAHNVEIGAHAVIVAQVGIAGSAVVGERAILAGQVGVIDHVVIGAGAVVMAQSGVPKDVPAGAQFFGSPALPARECMRVHQLTRRLPEFHKKLKELERRLEQLEG